ncbi:MAG: nitroreductase family protein [Candidatus Thermoplasmatota archaeon]|nr:nitroreductase family protein [Candidatus Thermoplasmatota archaeon]
MDVKEAIHNRRAYRSLDPVEITQDLITDLASCAQLSASCFNNQPWRYIFISDKETLTKMHEALSQGNEWAHNASMIIAVLSKKEYDCVIRDRVYYHFDTGMATAFLILRATDLGLVAHPIAGYSPKKTREILGIPEDLEVITLVIVGKHAQTIHPILSDKQKEAETTRPERFPLDTFVYLNRYTTK